MRLFTSEPPIVFRRTVVPSADPILGYELRPDAGRGESAISTAGLRDREFARPKPAATWRLAAIGDSLTYGSGGKVSAAFPKRLEALLDGARTAGAPRIEVLNLGVPGYNIAQIVQRLRVLGLSFAPDAIVYGYCLNDPQSSSVEAEALRRLRAAHETPASGVDGWLARSRLYRFARQRLAAQAHLEALGAQASDDPVYAAARSGDPASYIRALHAEGDAAARLDRGLDDLAALAHEHHIPVLVLIFPLFGSEGDDALEDVHSRVAQESARRGLSVLDLRPVYAAASLALGSPLRADFLHPDATGHRVAAVALFTWMCHNAWGPAAGIDCASPGFDETDAAIARAIAPALANAALTP